LRSYDGLKWQDVEQKSNFGGFVENHSLLENFQNSVPKGFIATPIDASTCCVKFREMWPTEIGKIVHCLLGKKQKFCLTL